MRRCRRFRELEFEFVQVKLTKNVGGGGGSGNHLINRSIGGFVVLNDLIDSLDLVDLA